MDFKDFTKALQDFTPPPSRFKQQEQFLVQRGNSKEYSKMLLEDRLKMVKKLKQEDTAAEDDTSED